MKKFILITLISILSFSLNAQEDAQVEEKTNAVKFGIKVGVNFADNKISDLDERTTNNSKPFNQSFHIGAVAEFKIFNKIYLQPELLYSSLKYSKDVSSDFFGTNSSKTEDKLSYLNLPVIAKYYALKGLSIEFGPQIGYLLSAKGEFSSQSTTFGFSNVTTTIGEAEKTRFLKRYDYGLNLGLGYKLNNGLNVSARYYYALSKVNDVKDSFNYGFITGRLTSNYSIDKERHQVIQVSIGYLF